MFAWLTKNNIPSGRVSFVVTLPDDETWRADFLGAFFLLTQPQNWELDQGLIPQQMADEWTDIFNDFVESGGDVLLEDVTAERLRLTATDAVSVSSTTHPLQIGPTSGLNIVVDGDDVLARNNGVAATLFLNRSAASTRTNILWATATGATTLTGTASALQTGATAGANIAVDTVSIQARNNGAVAPLTLNPLGGTVKITQPSTSATIPPIHIKQASLGQELIRLESTVGTGNPINTTALGAYYGRVRVYIEGVGVKWLSLYD